jgi:hypothetical protein
MCLKEIYCVALCSQIISHYYKKQLPINFTWMRPEMYEPRGLNYMSDLSNFTVRYIRRRQHHINDLTQEQAHILEHVSIQEPVHIQD